jgi:hypothetical protein
MNIVETSRTEFLRTVYGEREAFLDRIREPEVFIVRRFYDPDDIRAWRRKVFDLGQRAGPSWHPLYDGCPDYHRLHDNYPNAHVKAKMHAFYFHGWYEANNEIFSYFQEIFALKHFLAGFDPTAFLRNVPSDGQVARVNFHNYPRGGGYLAEHADPTSPFALIQTLVQASAWKDDFASGGLYARPRPGAEKLYLDEISDPGDLLVLSPDIPHGVDPIDPQEDYGWRSDRGKWTIIPIIVSSDYDRPDNIKPRQL